MTDTLYRSTSPVSHRVDIAWRRGYETGRAEGRKLAVVALAVAVLTLWRHPAVRGHTHLIPWTLVGSLVALSLMIGSIPFVLAVLGIRWGVRRRRNRPGVQAAITPVVEGQPDKDWAPF
ncbi:MAG: hypothetical protein IVW52_18880 [Acidimicrobiales bacterium]|nr:hypothetical protein [Acidimicrobiales bacterium]